MSLRARMAVVLRRLADLVDPPRTKTVAYLVRFGLEQGWVALPAKWYHLTTRFPDGGCWLEPVPGSPACRAGGLRVVIDEPTPAAATVEGRIMLSPASPEKKTRRSRRGTTSC